MTARARIWAVAPWGATVLLTALIAHYSVRVHSIQPDERISIAASRTVLDHPLWAIDPAKNITGRGFERGIAVLFAAVQWIVGDTARAYWVEHVISALLFALIIPIIAGWARDLGLTRPQALAAGVVACCVPWMVLGTSFLNSDPAYPLTALALWAMWRSTVQPSLRRDVLGLLAVLLLAVARIGNVVVLVAWPLAVLAFTIHSRRPLTRVVRDHPLLVAVAVAGILGLIFGGTHWLVGGYPVRTPLGSAFRTLLRGLLAYMAMGVAVVPAILALAWCARSLVRPANAGAAAFAASGLGAFLAFTYVAATQGAEERYIAPLAPVMLLMAMVAVMRRAVHPLLVFVAGVVVARAIAVTGTGADIGPYGFFAAPAQSFFRRVVLGKASLIGPLPDHHLLTAVLVIAIAAAVLAAVLTRVRPAFAYGASALVVGGFGLAGGVYSMSKFVNQAGYPNLTFAQQAWIDRAVGTDADVALAPEGLTGVAGELGDFNRALGSPYAPRRAVLQVDPANGAISGLPRYLVVQDGLSTAIGLTGAIVARTTYLPQNALLLTPQQRALWLQTAPRAVRVFATRPGECMTVTIVNGSGRFTVGNARGVLAGAPVAVVAKLSAGRAAVQLRLRGGGNTAAISGLGRGPCP